MNAISPNPQPSALFNRQRLRQNRLRARANFADHNVLFEEVTMQLLDRLQGINRSFNRILDLGSRNFSLSKSLSKQDASRFIVHCPTLPDVKKLLPHHVCVADEEWLPFRDASFDLIISNLNLHWANDLPGALIQMRRALKPDGFFLSALFGGETLRELRECLYEAEMQLRGGVSQHISPFADIQDCGSLLQRAGFTLPVVDKERFTLTYQNSFQLMRELRGMGESNILNSRDKRFMPSELFIEADRIYRNRYATKSESGKSENGPSEKIDATFDIIFIAGWAPHDNQQKPLKPGEAQSRLAKALNTQEILTGEKSSP
ncbi:MAG: methyltransferase domain-containing protein [Alphaproteobacteria bacterium]|nr:methyltransferase domain-containing protein [Alphaproteobacteria bacterium]